MMSIWKSVNHPTFGHCGGSRTGSRTKYCSRLGGGGPTGGAGWSNEPGWSGGRGSERKNSGSHPVSGASTAEPGSGGGRSPTSSATSGRVAGAAEAGRGAGAWAWVSGNARIPPECPTVSMSRAVWAMTQGQRSLNRCSGRDFQHEVFAPTATAAFHSQTVAAGMLLQQRPTRRVLSSRPPSCCVTRPRAWSRTSILNRFASLLAGG